MDQSTGITYVAVRSSSLSNDEDTRKNVCDGNLEGTDFQIMMCVNGGDRELEHFILPANFWNHDPKWDVFFETTENDSKKALSQTLLSPALSRSERPCIDDSML